MAAAMLAGNSSCVGSLDQYPHTSTTSNDVYTSVEGYQMTLGGIYAAFIQRISNLSTEARSQNYIRTLMMFQDCSTDACDAIWLAGESLTDINGLSWNAGDPWCSAMYYHIYNIVAMTNELIRNASDEDRLSQFNEQERAQIEEYRNEARFLRAYAYTQAIDFYNKMPFVTEEDGVGTYIPRTYDRAQMFAYVTAELEEIAPLLDAENYGHANRGAAYALLARLYLNGETWTGTPYYDECITACRNVMADGYSLESDYGRLFNGDNHLRSNEIIFAFACDGTSTTTWDATTFITCGEVLANYEDYEAVWGTEGAGAWNNLRARPELVDAFETGDTRARFIDHDRTAVKDDQGNTVSYNETPRSKDITAHDDATTGYRVYKWTNLGHDGQPLYRTEDAATIIWPDTDIPLLRLADVYLMYAESAARTGQNLSTAVSLVNQLRARGYENQGNYTINENWLTASAPVGYEGPSVPYGNILNERERELYWEGQRRTDLIRFGLFTGGTYLWEWKNNAENGASTNERYNLYPIPQTDMQANGGLTQNPGY